jgi:integrase/recombinase XerD
LVDHGTSPISVNAAITRLKFFFAITADQAGPMARMQPVRIPRTLPVVLSRVEVSPLSPPATSNTRRRSHLPTVPGYAPAKSFRSRSATSTVSA